MIANRINKLMNTDKFIEGLRETLVKLSQKKRRRRILEVIDVVSAPALGTWELNVQILSRLRGRPTLQLSGMSLRKKKNLPKKFLASVAPHKDHDDLHYSEHSDEKLKEEYCVLYMELMKVRESN
jgi:hypothetical protein